MFDLRIPSTSVHIERLKDRLRAFLPGVKSSHRVEAMARGFGFNTYAAMLAHVNSDSGNLLQPNHCAFDIYMRLHSFETPLEVFYHAVAAVAIYDVMEQVPRLTAGGIGIGPIRREDAKQNPKIFTETFTKEREELLSKKCIGEFLRSLALIKRIAPTKTINPGVGSYKLKHIAENLVCTYPTGKALGPRYVANGSFIAAAVHAGFKFRDYHGSQNVTFNMSRRNVDDLDCEIRPDGSKAQERNRKERLRRLSREYRLPIKSISSWA